jgi:hypothetical protein
LIDVRVRRHDLPGAEEELRELVDDFRHGRPIKI